MHRGLERVTGGVCAAGAGQEVQPTPPVSVQPSAARLAGPELWVTGSSPSPLLSKDSPRSVFRAQYAPPDWCWANILQDVTQPVLLQEPFPNLGNTIPSSLSLPLVVPL